MSILDSVRSVFRRSPPPSATTGASDILALIQPWGQVPRRGARELLQAYAVSPRLRMLTHRIAHDVASVRWHLYRRQGAHRVEIYEHPLLNLWQRPNSQMSGRALRQVTQLLLDLGGEAFLVKERNALGQALALWPVPAYWVMTTPSAPVPFYRVAYAQWQRNYALDEVVWLRDLNPLHPYARGVGIGESLADEIDTDMFASKQTKSFFYNNGMPGGIVSVDGLGGTNDAEFKAAREKFEQTHRGANNAFRLFWTNQKITVSRLDNTFKDMQLVELRRAERDIFIETYNVPPEIVGVVENSNRSTIDAAQVIYGRNCLVPRLELWKEDLAGIVADYDPQLELDYEVPIPTDRTFRLEVQKAFPGEFSRNEKRALADLDPVEGGDELQGDTKVRVPETKKELPPRVIPAPVWSDPPWAVSTSAADRSRSEE